MRVHLWGVRGGIASCSSSTVHYGGNTPCVSVRSAAGEWLVLDAGTGLRNFGKTLMRQAEAQATRTEISVLISHFHWDHIQGLPFFAPLWSSRFAIHIYASGDPEATERCVRHQFESPYFPVAINEAGAAIHFHRIDRTAHIAGLRVTPFPQFHPGGSTGFRVEEQGTALVYATDSEGNHPTLEPELVAQAHGAKLLLLDAQYTPEEAAERIGWGHGDWRRCCEVARQAAVEQLLLFHHDPSRTDQELDSIVEQAQVVFRNTTAAREGTFFDIA